MLHVAYSSSFHKLLDDNMLLGVAGRAREPAINHNTEWSEGQNPSPSSAFCPRGVIRCDVLRSVGRCNFPELEALHIDTLRAVFYLRVTAYRWQVFECIALGLHLNPHQISYVLGRTISSTIDAHSSDMLPPMATKYLEGF
jgi:hypothetical protein